MLLCMSITFSSKNVFAGLSPAIKNSTYTVNQKGWETFQSDYKEGNVEFYSTERAWLQAIADRFKRMSGKTKSVGQIKAMLLSKLSRFGHWQVSNLENSGFDGASYEAISLTALSEDDNLEVIIFTDTDGTEYPLVKWTGNNKKPCGNPVRAKKVEKIEPDIKIDITWKLSGKSRCNNGVSEVEKISSDGQSVWVPGGNACPPPCDPSKAKVIETMVYMDTTWYKWQNDCGDIKYTYDAKPKITKVDGPCNCPKVVDAVKNKKVYNRYPAFVPQAPYLPQGQMVYVNQQPRIIYQNIPSPNRGGPVEGNPGSGSGGGNPTGGNPFVPINVGNTNPTGGNPGYYTNPFGNTNGTPANPGYYLNGVWIPTGGNPGTGTGNPIGG